MVVLGAKIFVSEHIRQPKRFLEHNQGWEVAMTFRNRKEAGRALAERLQTYAGRNDVQILALPRGGVPVAFEIAEALGAPMDVFIVQKLGLPDHEELAMGAIASGGVRVLNEEVIEYLQIPDQVIEEVTALKQKELARRERLYRGNRHTPNVRGRIVILVDDGLATGSTMRAAVLALRQHQPARIIVAVPVAPLSACEEFIHEADDCVCILRPMMLDGVGRWYSDFTQTTDREVQTLLQQTSARNQANIGDGAPVLFEALMK
jgi:putative phosphoribosyl transferase